MLRRLLQKLEEQETSGLFCYSVVVVDNDRCESARQIVEAGMQQTKFSISYYTEPEQNIALARNKAIEKSNGNYIVLIDDDEFPIKDWLVNLYKAILMYDADGILGPVLPVYETKPPKWVTKGHLFDRPTHPTGHVMDWRNTRTGNALLKHHIFENNRNWFNALLGSGGEDRDFFRRKIQEGFRFIWCNEGYVYEIVPRKRWKRTVLLKRAFLRGKMALRNAESKPKSVLYSSAALLIYTAFLPILFIAGHHHFMRCLIKDFDHMGKIFAYLGVDLVKEKYILS